MDMTNPPANTSFFYWQGMFSLQFTIFCTSSSLKFELSCHYQTDMDH